MFALHIENKVNDYEKWVAAFDKYEQFRRERGVQAYRISRATDDQQRVYVDLDFATRDEAEAFIPQLETVWRTPQSTALLASHEPPEVRDVVEHRQ